MLNTSSILASLLVVSFSDGSAAFSSGHMQPQQKVKRIKVKAKSYHHYVYPPPSNCQPLYESASNDGANDDDGWGTSADSDIISKSKELERLKNDIAMKQKHHSRDTMNALSTGSDGGERDLFIPIVTFVSVIGFTGLYGYEMLRLYSRGELYLPWEN